MTTITLTHPEDSAREFQAGDSYDRSGPVDDDDIERALSAALAVLREAGVTPEAADAAYRRQWEEFDDEMNQRIEKGEISLDDAQEEMEYVEFDTKVILLGDWIKVDGKYSIDPNGKEGFAAEYNSGTGTICVEYSKHTKLCNNTSPCYVMADGSGPCGDLDSEGDTVIAYTLPVEFFRDAA